MGSRAGAAKSERTEADHQGGLCLAGSPSPRVLIIAPFLPSMRNCTIGLAFAQADRTYNASPNAKEKAPVPFSKLETYPGGWGFYPLSILCLIRSAKITASVMIEFRAGDGRWRHRSTLESRRFFGCPLGVLPAEGGKSGVNDPMGISNRIY